MFCRAIGHVKAAAAASRNAAVVRRNLASCLLASKSQRCVARRRRAPLPPVAAAFSTFCRFPRCPPRQRPMPLCSEVFTFSPTPLPPAVTCSSRLPFFLNRYAARPLFISYSWFPLLPDNAHAHVKAMKRLPSNVRVSAPPPPSIAIRTTPCFIVMSPIAAGHACPKISPAACRCRGATPGQHAPRCADSAAAAVVRCRAAIESVQGYPALRPLKTGSPLMPAFRLRCPPAVTARGRQHAEGRPQFPPEAAPRAPPERCACPRCAELPATSQASARCGKGQCRSAGFDAACCKRSKFAAADSRAPAPPPRILPSAPRARKRRRRGLRALLLPVQRCVAALQRRRLPAAKDTVATTCHLSLTRFRQSSAFALHGRCHLPPPDIVRLLVTSARFHLPAAWPSSSQAVPSSAAEGGHRCYHWLMLSRY